MRRPVLTWTLVLLTAGCGDFPNLGGTISERARAAPYPRLAPIEGLVIAAIGPSRPGTPQDVAAALAQTAGPLQARIDALRRRAAILRGAPINDATRARLTGG